MDSRFPLPAARSELLLVAQGLICENYERACASGTSILIGGTTYFQLVGVRAGDLITNVHLIVSVAGATMTLSKVGLYSPAGNRLALSADLGVAWQSTGFKTHALSAPYAVPSDGAVFVALIGAGTTLPTMARQTTSQLNVNAVPAGGSVPYGTEPVQTDLDPTAVIGTALPIACWVGLS